MWKNSKFLALGFDHNVNGVAVSVGNGVDKNRVLGSRVVVTNVQLVRLGVVNSRNNVVGPSADSQLKSLLLGQTASAELVMVVVKNNRDLGVLVNVLVKVSNGIK